MFELDQQNIDHVSIFVWRIKESLINKIKVDEFRLKFEIIVFTPKIILDC
jgi:hypothetical protein